MVRNLRAFLEDESGVTSIEYGLIAAGVALAVLTVARPPRDGSPQHFLHAQYAIELSSILAGWLCLRDFCQLRLIKVCKVQ
jgi:hypothetical protein